MQSDIYTRIAFDTSRNVTGSYSNSFGLAVRMLPEKMRNAVYSIYGFVRFADEIVDTFHDHDKEFLLNRFEEDVFLAIKHKISLNPVLHSFQLTARNYNITDELINSFLTSMKKDLFHKTYNQDEYREYIFGSADVVGLMCLKVFVNGNEESFESLKEFAMKLGSAFQKVNFLRDVKHDYEMLERKYFPGVNMKNFNETDKANIVEEINSDLKIGLAGIKKLPAKVQPAVYTAFTYYKCLLSKLEKVPPSEILQRRISIPNYYKLYLLAYSYSRLKLRLN